MTLPQVNTAEHTAGLTAERWFVHARLDEEVGTMVLALIPGRDHDIVADCWGGGSADHDKAAQRARLIAAAPELLDALIEILVTEPAVKGAVYQRAMAAISKATGQ